MPTKQPYSDDRMYANNFPQMTVDKANNECSGFYDPDKAEIHKCAVCTMKVVVHCGKCKIQVSGCLCTEEMNHGEEIARQRMLDRGVWLPAWGEKPSSSEVDRLMHGEGRPIDPGSLHRR